MVKFLQKKYNVNIFIPRQSNSRHSDRYIELSPIDPNNDDPKLLENAKAAINRLINSAERSNEFDGRRRGSHRNENYRSD